MGKKWLTPKQYSKVTGLGIEEIKKQCNLGQLESFKTEGGYYKVAYYESSSQDDETLIRENEKLRQALKNIQQMLISTLEGGNKR